jgi:hypothetical protein
MITVPFDGGDNLLFDLQEQDIGHALIIHRSRVLIRRDAEHSRVLRTWRKWHIRLHLCFAYQEDARPGINHESDQTKMATQS